MHSRLLSRLDRRLLSARPDTADPLGWRCFQLGLFVLAGSTLFGEVLLGIALIQGCRRRSSPWADPCVRLLLLVSLLLLLGATRAYSGWLAWAGLANWLPFFVGFWGYQAYLTSAASRRRAALMLVAGTVPVIVSGLGQMWWGWRGPFLGLWGLIHWYVLPGGSPPGRLAGLFDYANIAGAWLAVAWPLTLAALVQPRLRWRGRLAVLAIAVGVVLCIYLSESRNAWGALLLSMPLVSGPRSWPLLLPPLLLVLLLLGAASLPGLPTWLQQPARLLVPEEIWSRLSDAKYASGRQLASTRVGQWSFSLGLIAERPWLGWGAAAFSVIYPLRRGVWHGHAHNLPIDLAVSFGLPAAVLLVALVLALLLRSAWRGMASRAPLFDRAWWTAALVLTSLHSTDLPFYDSRLNVVGWVLLAGLRCYSGPPSPAATAGDGTAAPA
ncbi:MAG: O-antigen ligase family protein [Synechococcaceae cyanobacterium]|nr:O-antigen ligase family protein [Synechococcaceae cyanobacterium]